MFTIIIAIAFMGSNDITSVQPNTPVIPSPIEIHIDGGNKDEDETEVKKSRGKGKGKPPHFAKYFK